MANQQKQNPGKEQRRGQQGSADRNRQQEQEGKQGQMGDERRQDKAPGRGQQH
ncbi:hypothetical protein [Sphingobium aquiterrae]|uniref:hypothetical protein n=1 Tax=Sphingobium aquiterrae TaxID=2038656 RepID=UPI00301A0DAC